MISTLYPPFHGCLASCRDGDIRLTGSSTLYEGRLEICSPRSLWGTVCNTQWTEANTRVVCRNLGYINEEGIVTQHYRYLFCSFYAPFTPGNWGMLETVVGWDVSEVRQLSRVCTCTDGSAQCSGCVVYGASATAGVQVLSSIF